MCLPESCDEAWSDPIVLTANDATHVAMLAESNAIPQDAHVRVCLQTESGKWVCVEELIWTRPVARLQGPGIYRLHRSKSSAPYAVEKSAKAVPSAAKQPPAVPPPAPVAAPATAGKPKA